MNSAAPLELRGVRRVYQSGGGALPVLRGADLTLHSGEIVALAAPSGAGKSTLLHLAGLLEKPDGGSVMVDGRDAGALGDAERTAIRRDMIGFVYQFHHLLGEFSALENVVLPQMIAGRSRRDAAVRASGLLRCARTGGACPSPSGQAFRRRAAARGDRPGLGQRTSSFAGRRAHREPGCRDGRRGVRGADGDGSPTGRRCADRHS